MRSRSVAWTLCGLVGLAALLTAALNLLIAADDDVPADLAVGAEDIFWVAVILGFGLVGALIATRQPRNPIGWVFCAGALAFGLSGVGESYAIYGLFADPGGPLEGGRTMAWFSTWVWVPGGIALVLFFPLLFPSGRLLSARWRPVAAMAIVAAAFLSVGIAFSPGRFDDFPQVENPYGVAGTAGDVFGAFQSLGWLLLVFCLVASATSLVLRYRRARGVERLQLKWVAAASVLLVTSFLLWEVWEGLVPLGIGAMVVAAGIAILRYRLYDIDVVINRTLVYGILTATLAGAYLATVLLLQVALIPLTEESDLAIAGSTLAVAALFRPARRRIQATVDRRFYRRRYDAARTLESFGARLRDQVELDSLSAELRAAAVETMQPSHVSLWVRRAPR